MPGSNSFASGIDLAWEDDAAYRPGMLVIHGGAAYLCILAHEDQEPPNATYWIALSDESHSHGGGGVPVGLVAPFCMASCTGWLLADGALLDKTTNPEYTDLVDVLRVEHGGSATHPFYHADSDKAYLPDLRGYFVRGKTGATVSSRDKDGDRDAGHYQADAVLNHLHQMVIGSHGHNFDAASGSGGYQISSFSGGWKSGEIQATNLGTKTSGNPTANGAAENTVKNVALYYLVKY